MRATARALSIVALLGVCAVVQAAGPVRLYAAGSLRAAMDEIGAAFAKRSGTTVVGEFGASGLLRERIVKGAPAEVFASANMEHPRALADAGRGGPVVRFARNRLCALTAPRVNVTTETLLERMLDPAVKLGTSTPKADPSGDYAWKLFHKADTTRPGAFKALAEKALQLIGGPDSAPAPKDRSAYGMLVARGDADIFLTYCTNALVAQTEEPALRIVPIPSALAVGADYGLTVIDGASPAAHEFAQYVLSGPGQEVLLRHGFTPVALP